jgi:hypothetical protein
MTQTTLDFAPLSHGIDTEDAAAERASKTVRLHRELVLLAVKEYPASTAGELSMSVPFDAVEVRRRLYDLKLVGLVRTGEPRKCEVQGTLQKTYSA